MTLISPLLTTAPFLEPRPLERAILLAVAYADVFDQPVTAREIHRYLPGRRATSRAVMDVLEGDRLVPRRLSRVGRYFTLPGRESLVEVRSRRERIASGYWQRAERVGRAISRLPFVRMVAVTGSLAADNTDTNSDIDFLIVIRPGRLWITRLMVVAVSRLESRRGPRICPNYILSERVLALRERTLYTARELAQMVPLSGAALYRRMREANAWAAARLPNAQGAPPRARLRQPMKRARAARALKRLGEGLLGGRVGAWLERREQAIKIPMASRAPDPNGETRFTSDEFKGHGSGHGGRTMAAFAERLSSLRSRGHE